MHWSSQIVRNTFIEYFKGLDHHHVRSSPVIPWNDPTLAFVNAGMNQVSAKSVVSNCAILILNLRYAFSFKPFTLCKQLVRIIVQRRPTTFSVLLLIPQIFIFSDNILFLVILFIFNNCIHVF